MTLTLKAVPVDWVHTVWPGVENFIAEALKYCNGEYTLDQVRALVSAGAWRMVVATDDTDTVRGVATINFYNRPNERVAQVTSIGGKLVASPETFKQLKIFAQSNGATVIEGNARESVARLWRRFGFAEKCRIVEVKL